ncbi:MAG: SCO family protein [Pseudomonadota bacterium]
MSDQQSLFPKSATGRIGLVMVLFILAGFAGFLGYRMGGGGDDLRPQLAQDQGRVPIGGAFTLVDSNGNTVTEKDLMGRYSMVYFGYTYCPDICPTALATVARSLDLLEVVDPHSAQMVLPVFITIDPERDTPEAVGVYAEAFHPRLLGLTGTPEQVAVAAKAYRVFYQKVHPDTATEYLMDHASSIFLMDPAGNYVSHFPHNMTPDEVARRLEETVIGAQQS